MGSFFLIMSANGDWQVDIVEVDREVERGRPTRWSYKIANPTPTPHTKRDVDRIPM